MIILPDANLIIFAMLQLVQLAPYKRTKLGHLKVLFGICLNNSRWNSADKTSTFNKLFPIQKSFPIPFLRVLGNDKRLSATIGKESSVINNGVKLFLKEHSFFIYYLHSDKIFMDKKWKQERHAKYSFKNDFNPYCIKYHENGIIKERNSKSFTFLHICWWKKKFATQLCNCLVTFWHGPNLM